MTLVQKLCSSEASASGRSNAHGTQQGTRKNDKVTGKQ